MTEGITIKVDDVVRITLVENLADVQVPVSERGAIKGVVHEGNDFAKGSRPGVAVVPHGVCDTPGPAVY